MNLHNIVVYWFSYGISFHFSKNQETGRCPMADAAYPQLILRPGRISQNAAYLASLCAAHGVEMTAVVKGCNAHPDVVRAILSSGIHSLATSRLSQMEACEAAGLHADWMLLRAPTRAECEATVRLARISLQSDLATILHTEAAAARLQRTHEILVMVDMGDLREGIHDMDELDAVLTAIRDRCPHLTVAGIGTTFGDFSAVMPDAERLSRFATLADRAEAILGYPMRLVSGGSTFVLPAMLDGLLPKRVNHLRLGETMLLAHDLVAEFGRTDLDGLCTDTMLFKAEVIDLHQKPSCPQGEPVLDAFGNRPSFPDEGIRTRAVLSAGRLDFGDPAGLVPVEPGLRIVGATSDHLVLDVTDAAHPVRTGDVITFRLTYGAMLFLTAAADVRVTVAD